MHTHARLFVYGSFGRCILFFRFVHFSGPVRLSDSQNMQSNKQIRNTHNRIVRQQQKEYTGRWKNKNHQSHVVRFLFGTAQNGNSIFLKTSTIEMVFAFLLHFIQYTPTPLCVTANRQCESNEKLMYFVNIFFFFIWFRSLQQMDVSKIFLHDDSENSSNKMCVRQSQSIKL